MAASRQQTDLVARPRRRARRAPPPPPPTSRWRRWWSQPRSRRRLLLGGTALFVGVVALLVVRLFVAPQSVTPEPSDAVVALGDDPARVARAVDLMHEHLAPVLVLPGGAASDEPTTAALCAGGAPYEVLCPPVDATGVHGGPLRAGARVAGQLADTRGWRAVTVVAGPAQLSRSRLLVERCTAARVEPIVSDGGRSDRASRVRSEIGPYVRALLFDRGC